MVILTIAQHIRLWRCQIPLRTKRDTQHSAPLSSSTPPDNHLLPFDANGLIGQIITALYFAPSTMHFVVPWLKPGTIEAADVANKTIPSNTTEP